MNTDKKQQCWEIISYLVLTAIFLLLLWRSRFGFIWSDEPYYFETAYRFIQGDLPIVNDWYTAQIYSVLLVPFVYVWKLLSGGDFTGLFLAARYSSVCLQFAVALLCYRMLRKHSPKAALVGAVFFMVYCRANIGTISYYMVGSAAILLSFVMLDVFVRRGVHRTIRHFIVGLLWGVAIVCNPYLLLLFLPFFMILCLRTVQKKSNTFDLGSLVALFCGTACVAVYFIGYIVYKGVTIRGIMSSLGYIMSDPSYYGSGGLLMKLLYSFAYVANHFRYTIPLSVVSAGYLLLQYVRGARLSEKKILILFVINTVILIMDVVYPARSVFTIGSAMAALSIWGWQIFFLTKQKDWKSFWFFYVTGCLIALLMGASSDTHFSATTQGFMIASVGTVILTERFREEACKMWQLKKKERVLCKYLLYISVLLVLLYSLYDRIFLVYRDRPIDQLKVRIEAGPAKGISTTAVCAERYDTISAVMRKLNGTKGNLYIMGFCPWGYLYTGMSCSPYTAWRIMPEAEDSLGCSYYTEHPDKFPDIVLRLSYDYSEYTDATVTPDSDKKLIHQDEENRIIMNREWDSTWLIGELKRQNYRRISVNCGTLYIRNTDEYHNINSELFK